MIFLTAKCCWLAPLYLLLSHGIFSCTEQKQINILFLMDDQHRGDAIGAAGATWLETPHLDRLAAEGVMFTRAYVSIPSCLPARTSILTGKSPWGHGILGYYAPAEFYQYELPRMFTEAGYRTHAVGKNHFAPMRNTHGYETVMLEEGWHSVIEGAPKCDYQQWFERVAPALDMNATGLHYTDHRGGRYFLFTDSLHATHWTADRAVKFLRNYQGDRPWLLKVSFQRPHPPFDPPKRWHDHYQEVDIPLPVVSTWAEAKYGDMTGSLEEQTHATSGNFPKEEIMASLRSYYAGLSFVDEQLGRVIEALKKRGEYENTLILFTSDHGDMMGDHHMWRKCRPYEGSANVPMILRWPESLGQVWQRGQTSDALVELRDILPTFLDVAGMAKPEEMDGASMFDVMRGKEWRTVLDLEHSRIYEPDNAWVCLTDERYKYIYYTLTGQQQLFDLKQDPDELADLAQQGQQAALVEQWRQRMVEHLSVRGPRWVRDGDLVVQEESQRFGPADARFGEEEQRLSQ
jgi:choline-sulfatase